SGRSQNVDRMKPPLRQYRPARDRQLRRTQPEAVPPLREKMKLRRHLRILEGLKVDKGAFDMSRIVVICLKKKRRRGLGSGLNRGIYLAVGAAEPARINDHLKVRTGVDRGWRNILALEIGMRAEDSCKVRPGGEANNADAVRIDVP